MKRRRWKYKTLNSAIGRAIGDYAMITEGDRILVAVSGGADSLTLLGMLRQRQCWSPATYRLNAVHVDPGFTPSLAEPLRSFCRRLGVDLHIAFTDFGLVAHGPQNRENPCFLCARRRRQHLFEMAGRLGCRKIAMGHHKDDIIETFFLNVLYAGEVSTMIPAQPFFGGRFTVVRPLAYADADEVRAAADALGVPALDNPCPSAEHSRRQDVRFWLDRLYRSNRKIKGNIFRALRHVKRDDLLKP